MPVPVSSAIASYRFYLGPSREISEMDEGLPEIDKSEAMQKQITIIASRLAALENKLDAIARHLGVAGYELSAAEQEGAKWKQRSD